MERRRVTITWWEGGDRAAIYTETRGIYGELHHAHVRDGSRSELLATLAGDEWEEHARPRLWTEDGETAD